MKKYMPFYYWKRNGDFNIEILTIIPFFFYIFRSEHIMDYTKDEIHSAYAWGCTITPFLSLSFQFGNDKRK